MIICWRSGSSETISRIRASSKLAGDLTPRVGRIEPHVFVVEGHRAAAPGTLALIHRLVERSLRQVCAKLRRAHYRGIELPAVLLLQQHSERVVEQCLPVRRIEPGAAAPEDA